MNHIRSLLAGAALAAVPFVAQAGVIFVPITEYASEGLGDLAVEPAASGTLVVSTTGAQSRLNAACGGTRAPESAGLVVQTQTEVLRVSPVGEVDGRLSARMTQPGAGTRWDVDATVTGTAVRLPGATGGCRPLAIQAKATGLAVVPGQPRSLLKFEIQRLRIGVAGQGGTAARWQSEVAGVRLTGSSSVVRELLDNLEPAQLDGPCYPAAWEQ